MFDNSAKNTIPKRLKKFLFKNSKLIAAFVFIASVITISGIVVIHNQTMLTPLTEEKSAEKEVFGFAPYWTFKKLDNVDFKVLTTFAYFGIDVNEDGSLEKSGPGYDTFMSQRATEIFQKAHDSNTRVVLTLTMMKNQPILTLLESEEAQERSINEAIELVKARGIDGINIDYEYLGNPGQDYRDRFSSYVARFTERMHQEIPSSRVSVSVYASSVKDKKLYDIASIGNSADSIFMMAYDFATTRSDTAMPTAPLFGHKEGKYWYDVSTAVDDFLTKMPADKLILGVPWYGYNYTVNKVEIKAPTNKGYYQSYKKGRRTYSYFVPYRQLTQTYSIVENDITPEGVSSYEQGWDDYGKVGYKSYYSEQDGVYRMIFSEDVKSLSYKYEFAKDKNLAGVGIWALGFDNGRSEMWNLLSNTFGIKLADSSVLNRKNIN